MTTADCCVCCSTTRQLLLLDNPTASCLLASDLGGERCRRATGPAEPFSDGSLAPATSDGRARCRAAITEPNGVPVPGNMPRSTRSANIYTVNLMKLAEDDFHVINTYKARIGWTKETLRHN
ncbi:hypothetical protein EYF80_029652 [Liparis tanakae]|uniref:Uncharacterized protein n=1 Tax=Liparis tanakae TaxID=230148 RepID=A0A4Z2H3R1_9TELE|nr:hypothetical protein EYF80_029652 [Liparis tanakae]